MPVLSGKDKIRFEPDSKYIQQVLVHSLYMYVCSYIGVSYIHMIWYGWAGTESFVEHYRYDSSDYCCTAVHKNFCTVPLEYSSYILVHMAAVHPPPDWNIETTFDPNTGSVDWPSYDSTHLFMYVHIWTIHMIGRCTTGMFGAWRE